jgi:hypothetical protein
MLVKEPKSIGQILSFLHRVSHSQNGYELSLNKSDRKKNGVFLTKSIDIVENLLDIIAID